MITINNSKMDCCCCQKVIPLAFNESMSYLEQVCAIQAKLNEVISLINDDIDTILQNYIDQRFNDIMINSSYDSTTETLVLYFEGGNV